MAQIDDLRASANSSATVFRTVSLTYLIVIAYVAILALSVNDELLFRDGYLKLPILNLGARVSHYFTIAPLLLIALHLNLFIHGIILVDKTIDYKSKVHENVVDIESRMVMLRLLSSLPLSQAANDAPNDRALQRMLMLSTFIVTVPIPISVLVFMYVQFRPFQSASEYVIIVATGVDIFLVWFFWPRIYAIMNNFDSHSGRTSRGAKNSLRRLSSRVRTVSIRFTVNGRIITVVRTLFATLTPKTEDSGTRDNYSG